MTPFTRYMTQPATYWAPGVPDGFGGRSFNVPVEVMTRWQNQAVLFRNAQGEEVVSEAVVYVDRELSLGGMIALGTFTSATPDASAREVRQRMSSPDLSGNEVLHKVML